jgi:hypothetical protein
MAEGKIRFMMDFVTTDVILAIIENTGLDVQEAMKSFYNSEVFNRLRDSETGLYRESGGYVYELYKDEKKFGRLVQTEI